MSLKCKSILRVLLTKGITKFITSLKYNIFAKYIITGLYSSKIFESSRRDMFLNKVLKNR